jgi:hypothetical protein
MKYRKLRIAFSAVCEILCLLLIVLWVRSHFIKNWWYARLFLSQNLELTAQSGCISVTVFESSGPLNIRRQAWKFKKNTLFKGGTPFREMRVNRAGFGRVWSPKSKRVVFPFWLPVILFISVGTAPWIPHLSWRFSLRTLLITMTLVAVALGILIYAAT